MGILDKIFSFGKGKVTEAGQAFVDANSNTILDQEIRDAQTAANQAREELTKIMAQRTVAATTQADLTKSRDKYAVEIQACLNRNDDVGQGLAREVAERIQSVEEALAAQTATIANFDKNIATIKANLKAAEAKIERIKQQADLAKANASAIRAQAAVASSSSGLKSSLGSAADSLARLQSRQVEEQARIDAANQLEAEANGGDLDQRLAAANIGTPNTSSVDAILARYAKPSA